MLRCRLAKEVKSAIEIIAWHPGVFEDGSSGSTKDTVAWEPGYEGLWIHSGWDFWIGTFTPANHRSNIRADLNEVQPLKAWKQS